MTDKTAKVAVPARMLLNPVHFLSLGFGSGLSPFAPGTAGTLIAIPLYLLMMELSSGVFLFITLALFLLGIFLCGKTAEALGVHDHGAIVWDEIVGYLTVMLLVPPSLFAIVMGFILFRIFDIWKPWPIRMLDRKVEGGFGIMLDDLVAALYAAVLLHAFLYIIGVETIFQG